MGLNYCASSPSVVLPPPSTIQTHLPSHTPPQTGAILDPSSCAFQQQSDYFQSKTSVTRYPRLPSLNHFVRTSKPAAGLKRSREDLADDNEHEHEHDTKPQSPQTGSIVEPDMPLISSKTTTHDIPPDPSSATWSEELLDPKVRPRQVPRKSHRAIANAQEIDPIIFKLGIGWRQVFGNSVGGIAGSETFLKKQFTLNDPRIFLHHDGLGIYVVRSDPIGAQSHRQQWWLFRDDLKSCRFLCNDDNDLYHRLNNKRQDERGNWLPDILVQGPEVFAKDVSQYTAIALSPIHGIAQASDIEPTTITQQQHQHEDIQMDGVM